MARYKLNKAAFVGVHLLQAGTEIGDGTKYPFDGEPGEHMEPLDDEAEAALKAARAKRNTGMAALVTAPAPAPAPEVQEAAVAERVNAEVQAQMAQFQEAYATELAEKDETIASLQKAVAMRDEQIAELQAQIAKFDPDGDGKPGGARKKAAPKDNADLE